MRQACQFVPWRKAPRWAPVALSVALMGCADLGLMQDTGGLSSDTAAQVRAAAQEAPSFKPGDRFTLDNPTETWTVAAVEGERVTWVSDTGARQVTTRNPLLPALEWSSSDRGNGRRLISGQSQPMFPLAPGKDVAFRATVDTDQPPFAWEFEWTCAVGGLETTSVPAGEFATYRVACGRGGVEETVMFYAPEIGYNARMVVASETDGATAERRLTAFARAGETMSDGMAAAPTGDVQVEEETEGALPMRFGDEQESTEEEGAGPTALGMIAGDGSAGGAVPAPATTPESELMADTQTASMADAAPDTAAGSIGVHLASYKDAANAETVWKQLMSANRDILEGTRPVVLPVDIPGKGLFYRLHAGPVATRGAGEEMCRVLSGRGVYCKVVTF